MSTVVAFAMWGPFRESLIKAHGFYMEQAHKRLLSQFGDIEAEANKPNSFAQLKFSPDGKIMVGVVGSKVYQLDAYNGNPQFSHSTGIPEGGTPLQTCFSPDNRFLLSGRDLNSSVPLLFLTSLVFLTFRHPPFTCSCSLAPASAVYSALYSGTWLPIAFPPAFWTAKCQLVQFGTAC